jgi:hypothetical protein
LIKQNVMATQTLDKDYVTIKVPKNIGASRIKRIRDYAKSVEEEKSAPIKKVPQRIINELSREINAKAWDRILEKFDMKPQ